MMRGKKSDRTIQTKERKKGRSETPEEEARQKHARAPTEGEKEKEHSDHEERTKEVAISVHGKKKR